MAHDHNGRVGPPRCEECNAPMNSDDRRLRSTRSLCLDCHLERHPFPRIKERKGRIQKTRQVLGRELIRAEDVLYEVGFSL